MSSWQEHGSTQVDMVLEGKLTVVDLDWQATLNSWSFAFFCSLKLLMTFLDKVSHSIEGLYFYIYVFIIIIFKSL